MRERNWIELFVGLAALAVSGISLWVGVRTEQANEDMVAATTWPVLQYGSSDLNDSRQPEIKLLITNGGVGPAKLMTLEMFYRGKPMSGPDMLLAACCGGANPQGAGILEYTANGTLIRPGEERDFLRVIDIPQTRPLMAKLETVRNALSFRACYCSVLNRCWISDLTTLDPMPVKVCPVPKVPYNG